MTILFGIIGAVVGFFVPIALLSLSDVGRNDPITSGMAALGLGVFSAAGGLMLGVKLAMSLRGGQTATVTDVGGTAIPVDTRPADSGAPARAVIAPAPAGGTYAGNTIKAAVITVLAVAVVGAIVSAYMISNATPWLNPKGGTVWLQFEVRLPAGGAWPVASEIGVELQTDLNRMPGELRPEQFRRDDGDRPVIVGEVELAFRTARRQLAVKMEGQPERVYSVGLAAKPPQAAELGPWQKNADGTEIRYRAKWPEQN
jgi:hypothetical protein